MHLQDCISDNPSGAIAKQEITSRPQGRYTRGLHCYRISPMQYQALYSHPTSRNVDTTFFLVFRVVLAGFGWFWLVLAGFGWFWLVPCFSNHAPCVCPSEGHKHGVSLQSSLNLGDTLLRVARE